MKNSLSATCILALLLLSSLSSQCSNDPLAKKISISVNNQKIPFVLDQVAREGGFAFSYDARIFPEGRRITYSVGSKAVSEILKDLFGTSYTYILKGKYVIIRRSPEKKRSMEHKAAGGAEEDPGSSRNKLQQASVPAKPDNASTGDSAIRRLEIKNDSLLKMADTSIISPEQISHIEQIPLVSFMVPQRSRDLAENAEFFREDFAQLSLIPGWGTNGKLSGTYGNAVSLNLIAGYSRECRGFELGTLFNINRDETRGLQIGGIGNFSGGAVRGFQLAGGFSVSLSSLHGMRVSGLFNWLSDTLKGVQLSSLFNVTLGPMKGLDFSGITNLAYGNMNGCQFALLGNAGMKEINGAQVSGLCNYGRENWGFQLAGLVNVAKKDNRGAQVAGLVNYSKKQNGFQLGFLNITEETGNGTPLGFFSYTGKDGYYKAEVSADEVFWVNIAFRCGVPRLYNIFKTGIGDASMMNFSWGIGTDVSLGEKFSLCADFTLGMVVSGSENLKYHGLLSRLSPTLDFHIARHFTVFAGPAANLYWYNTGQTVKPDGIAPYTIYNEVFTTGPHAIQFWIGGVLGIKI